MRNKDIVMHTLSDLVAGGEYRGAQGGASGGWRAKAIGRKSLDEGDEDFDGGRRKGEMKTPLGAEVTT
ncbi:hypothetical protein ACFX13_036490 [Malus domestica]